MIIYICYINEKLQISLEFSISFVNPVSLIENGELTEVSILGVI